MAAFSFSALPIVGSSSASSVQTTQPTARIISVFPSIIIYPGMRRIKPMTLRDEKAGVGKGDILGFTHQRLQLGPLCFCQVSSVVLRHQPIQTRLFVRCQHAESAGVLLEDDPVGERNGTDLTDRACDTHIEALDRMRF